MNKLSASVCAKLNLTLDIKGVRDDSYHDLSMIMQSVDLCDDVTVELNDTGVVWVECGELSGDNNLAAKAAKLYFSLTGLKKGADITIKKRIPVCGGLAGGSADAAATLVILERLCGLLSSGDREKAALALGADVPFALVGGTAYVSGVGEKIKPLNPISNCFFVLANGGEKGSTGEMFARFDSLDKPTHPQTDKVLSLLSEGNISEAAKLFYNCFEQLWQTNLTKRIKALMNEYGCVSCTVSGSGPTFFGVFEDRLVAEKCASEIKKFTECYVCAPTEKSIFFE